MSELKTNIVVIADEHDLIFYLSNLLKSYGFAPFVAGQWKEALAAALKTRPALVIMDAMLAGHVAQQVYSGLKHHEILGHVPVLMLSSLTRRSLSRFYVNPSGGMNRRLPEPDAVLPRPPEADEFIAVVRELCAASICSEEVKPS